jgi:SAM-dependent methyltransferase
MLIQLNFLYKVNLQFLSHNEHYIIMSERIEFTIRDCITSPLINVKASPIDQMYFIHMRKFIDESVRNFLNHIDLNNKYIVDVGLTGYTKDISNPNIIYETIDIDPTNMPTYVCDITKNNCEVIPSERFDITIITEVLEHTNNPIAGIDECLRITKTGGYIVITTPLNFRIHGPMYDNFRMTEWFYKNLFKSHSVKIVKMDALEDASRTLYPISYFMVVQK